MTKHGFGLTDIRPVLGSLRNAYEVRKERDVLRAENAALKEKIAKIGKFAVFADALPDDPATRMDVLDAVLKQHGVDRSAPDVPFDVLDALMTKRVDSRKHGWKSKLCESFRDAGLPSSDYPHNPDRIQHLIRSNRVPMEVLVEAARIPLSINTGREHERWTPSELRALGEYLTPDFHLVGGETMETVAAKLAKKLNRNLLESSLRALVGRIARNQGSYRARYLDALRHGSVSPLNQAA